MPGVLLVDDSHLVGVVVNRILSGKNINCTHVRHVDDLFGLKGRPSMLREITPHAILLDIQMPVMDGVDVLRKLKSRPKLQDVPVLMISSDIGATRSIQEALQIGAAGFLAKPIDAEKLLTALAKISFSEELNLALEDYKGKEINLAPPEPPKRPPVNRMPPPAQRPAAPAPVVPQAPRPAPQAPAPRMKILPGGLDLNKFLDMLGGDEDLLQEIVSVFVESSTPLIEAIHKAMKKQDYNMLRIKAHELKGSVGNFGLDHITDAAGLLEALAARQDLSNAPRVYAQLEKEVRVLNGYFKQWLKEKEDG